MNVLWLASWYPNRLDKFTGDFIQRQAQATAQFCKVQVIFVKKDPSLKPNTTITEKKVTGDLTEQIIYYNSSKTNIKLFDRAISFFNYQKYFRKAVKQYFIEEGKPKQVHVHVAMYAGVVAMWIKRNWKIPYFVTEHWVGYYRECLPSIYDASYFFRQLNIEVLKKCNLFLPVTGDLGEKVNADFTAVKYKVIPNVVNTEFFNYKDPAPAKFRFIHISHINFQKNPEGMFAAAQRLQKQGYDFELFMLGNESEALNELANKYGLLPDVVIYKNAVPYKEVAVYIQRSSAFLLFSRFENLPCVLLEALCCGLPVISTDVGGIAEVVHEGNGILVANENIDELTAAMKKMIDDYHTYDKKQIAAEASAKFNYTTVGKQITDFYQ